MNALASWKASLSSGELTAAMVISAIVALVLLFMAFYYLKRARIIEDTPTSKIRSAAQGYVELVGPVIGGEAGELVAPLSQYSCVWYRYKVQRYRESGKKGSWQTVRQGTSDAWFQINDGTGTCVVDPDSADVITEHKRTWYGHDAIPAFSTNSSFFSTFTNDRYRYIEELIMPHETIYALGNFHTVGGGRNLPTTQQQVGEVIRHWKQDYNALLQRFDADGDGKIDMQEWDAVRRAAEREADKQRDKLAKTPAVNVLSRMPDRRYPFILSTHSQKRLAKRFRLFSTGMAVLTAAATGFLFYLF
ncbi:GIDE domain-containing protein [Motiliproteus sediminis]|uniref:GIDE domain-containing protein n=1 Tax=Motiliproteus sediminis TaxID=1468178 RepID=UPI001AF0280C|nr:GIDE domain-containing protein [Motiliproteus sediminis]